MRILAFDIGRETAAAWNGPRGEESCACGLGARGDSIGHLVVLEPWADDLMERVLPEVVFIERHTDYGAGSRTLDSYTHVIRLVAARRGVRCVSSVGALSARKLALGKGVADKAAAHRLAAFVLRLPKGLTPDEVDARILLNAAPGWLQAEAFKERMARLARNEKARARAAGKRAAA